MGGVLDCAANPLEGEIDLSTMEGPILKPFHAMSIKELAYNVDFEKREDIIRLRKGNSGDRTISVEKVEGVADEPKSASSHILTST